MTMETRMGIERPRIDICNNITNCMLIYTCHGVSDYLGFLNEFEGAGQMLIPNNTLDTLITHINSIRDEFDSVRNSVSGVSDEIMGKALNVTMPVVQTTIVGKDIGGKAIGGVTASIYAFFGSFMGVPFSNPCFTL